MVVCFIYYFLSDYESVMVLVSTFTPRALQFIIIVYAWRAPDLDNGMAEALSRQ